MRASQRSMERDDRGEGSNAAVRAVADGGFCKGTPPIVEDGESGLLGEGRPMILASTGSRFARAWRRRTARHTTQCPPCDNRHTPGVHWRMGQQHSPSPRENASEHSRGLKDLLLRGTVHTGGE